MSEGAIFSYSDLFPDDGGVDKMIDAVKRMETFIENVAQKLDGQLSIVDPKDTKEIDRLSKEVAKLTAQYDKLQTAKKANESTSKKAAQLRGKELIEMQRMRDAQAKENKEAAAVAKIKNTQAGSIENMRAKLALVTIAWAKLSAEERENGERGKRLVESKRQITEELKKVEKETGDNRRNVGNYSEAVREAIIELNKENAELTQNIGLLKQQQAALKKGSAEWLQYEKRIKDAEERLEKVNTELGKGGKKGFGGPAAGAVAEDIGGGIGNIASGASGGGAGVINAIGSGIGKIASKLGPVGLAIGAIVGGLTAVSAEIFNINTEFDNLRGTIKSMTGATGDELDQLVISAKGVSAAFGVDVNEVLTAQNVLMREFGLTGEEAARKIELGFLSNANAQGQLLDNIKEYSSQINDAGGSVEDLIGLLDHAATQGIFSDKGIAAVKEAGKKLREESDATKEALQNAFGKEFSDRILNGIKEGSITSVEAVQLISERMNDTTIDAKRLSAVVKDVFGSAGEDAGLRYLQSLKSINTELETLNDDTNEATQIQKANLNAQKELAGVQNEISKAIGDTSQIGVVWTKVQIGMYKALLGIINFVNKAIDAFQNWGTAAEFVIGALIDLADPLGLFHDMSEATEELTQAQREQMYVAIQAQHAIKDFIIANKKELVSIKLRVQAIGDENVSREKQIKNVMTLKGEYPELLADITEENLQTADLVALKTDLNKRFTEEMILRKKNMALKAVEMEADRQRAIIAKLAEGEAKDQAIENLNTFLKGADIRIAQTEEELKIFLGLKEREEEANEDQLLNVVNTEKGKQQAYKKTFDIRKTLYGITLEDLEKQRALELLIIERNLREIGATEIEIQRALTKQKIMILNEELAILRELGQQESEAYISQQIEKYKLQRELDEQNRQILLDRELKQAEVDSEIRENFLLKNEAAITESNDRITKMEEEYAATKSHRRKAELENEINQELEGQRRLFEEKKQLMREELDQEFMLKKQNAHSTIEDERLLNLELQRLEEEHNNALFQLDQDFNASMKALNDRAVKDEITAWENFEKKMEDILNKVLDKLIEIAEKEKKLAEERVDKQEEAVSIQAERAEAGLTNTLAFEQKALAQRELELIQRDKELQRRQKIKAVYAGYTNYSNQGEENPLGKALADQALMEVLEASLGGFYKGGYTGDGNPNEIAGVAHKGEFYVDAKTTKALNLKGKSMSDFKDMFAGGMYAPQELSALGTNFFTDQNVMFKDSVPDIGVYELTSEVKRLTKIMENKPDQSLSIQKTIEGFTELVHEIREGQNIKRIITRL